MTLAPVDAGSINEATARPVVVSQSMIVSSPMLPVASVLPSGAKVTQKTNPVCPARVATFRLAATSQSVTDSRASILAAASVLPSGENANDIGQPWGRETASVA